MSDDNFRDVVEITELFHRIATAADVAADLDDYMALMTSDVVFRFDSNPAAGLAGVQYEGHADVRSGAQARRDSGMQGPGTGTMHIVSNTVVHTVEGDTARASVYWRFYRMQDNSPTLNSMGTYDNALRRVNGHWLLAERNVTVY